MSGLSRGDFESIFSQADVATWAYNGTRIFDGRPRQTQLRLIANLYPEAIHVVVMKDSGIRSLADLKGKCVWVGEPGSGILINALMVLEAFGIQERDIQP